MLARRCGGFFALAELPPRQSLVGGRRHRSVETLLHGVPPGGEPGRILAAPPRWRPSRLGSRRFGLGALRQRSRSAASAQSPCSARRRNDMRLGLVDRVSSCSRCPTASIARGAARDRRSGWLRCPARACASASRPLASIDFGGCFRPVCRSPLVFSCDSRAPSTFSRRVLLNLGEPVREPGQRTAPCGCRLPLGLDLLARTSVCGEVVGPVARLRQGRRGVSERFGGGVGELFGQDRVRLVAPDRQSLARCAANLRILS